MPSQVFQLKTITRVLVDGVEIAEAIGFPEISALDDSERKWRVTLQAKAASLLGDPNLAPAIGLHRRRINAAIELDALEMTFDPPRRSAGWTVPVVVTIHFGRWEADGLFQAYVPALAIHVTTSRRESLADRVTEHVRLVLTARHKHITLEVLSELARVESLRLGELEVTVNIKTPRELAIEAEPAEEKTSPLSRLAEELPPLTGRQAPANPAAHECEEELRQLAETLSGVQRRSVLLVGPPGCGKTALVRELARRRKELGFVQVPFWTTNAARLMSGPVGFGLWQQRCQDLCREALATQAIVHLGPLADLLEVGRTSRSEQSVGGFLRPWIARGEVLAIAECHPDQLGAIERTDPHLLGAFQILQLAERTPEQTRRILKQVWRESPGRVGEGLGADVDAALERLQRLHARYATYSASPGRPLRFLRNLLSDQFPELALNEAHVVQGFSRETGLPRVLLDDAVPLDLGEARDWFGERVIGQPEAVEHVLDLLATVKSCLGRPRKPLASFLFIGPTGTGKTEMAKALAEYLFGDAGRLVRFDLNEFSDPVSVQRLIGGPTSCQAEGLLTARVREQPFSVLLLDEFEKADPAFFDLLLQALGDGRLTDAAGRVADFCNSVVVMTSNLGAQSQQKGPAGFRPEGAEGAEAQAHFTDAVRKFLRPEIYNRLDAIVPFHALSREVVQAIARRHLEQLKQRDGLRLRGVECEIRPEVAEWLARRGHDPRYGARPLKRAIERELLVPLAGSLNAYAQRTPLHAAVHVTEDRLQCEVRARAAGGAAGDLRLESVELAEQVSLQRRSVQRLRRSAAFSRIEDDVTLLESLQRRTSAARWKSPELQERLARLPAQRECLETLERLSDRACQLENEALGALYRREDLEGLALTSALAEVEEERRGLLQRAFRALQEKPNEVVLAILGEPRETMLEFAGAYFKAATQYGDVRALDYFLPLPGGRSAAGKALLREQAKKPENFFASPPEKAVAVVLDVCGDLAFPRLAAEAGLHVVKRKKDERLCLVQASRGPMSEYVPPGGIDRPGGIKALGQPVRRTYRPDDSEVEDSELGLRGWLGTDLGVTLERLMEDRLNKAMESIGH